MVACRITSGESARLKLGELIVLADRLQHSMGLLRHEGHETLETVCDQLEAQAAATLSKLDDQANPTRKSISRTRRELETAWLEVDHAVDELISQAADEIYRFTTIAESRIHECERRVRHDRARAELPTEDRSEQ